MEKRKEDVTKVAEEKEAEKQADTDEYRKFKWAVILLLATTVINIGVSLLIDFAKIAVHAMRSVFPRDYYSWLGKNTPCDLPIPLACIRFLLPVISPNHLCLEYRN